MPFIRLNNILLGLSALLLLTNCAGPYKGRLIDEKSGAPIQGVVVVGYWTNETPTLGGGATNCLDARETVSDVNGEFTVPTSTYGEFFGEMKIAIYKVGYEGVRCLWESLNRAGGCLVNQANWEGDRAIIPMKKVAKNRLMYEGEPPHVSCGRKDGKPLDSYIEAHKGYRRALGLKP
jgi:hypothetical protein